GHRGEAETDGIPLREELRAGAARDRTERRAVDHRQADEREAEHRPQQQPVDVVIHPPFIKHFYSPTLAFFRSSPLVSFEAAARWRPLQATLRSLCRARRLEPRRQPGPRREP